MHPKQKPLKDKHIKVFQAIETHDGTIKKYIHPKNTTLLAYVRQLSTAEQNVGNAAIDGSTIEFTVNQRAITNEMFVEFRSEEYQIDGVDNFEFRPGVDIKFLAHKVNNGDYIEIQETEW